MRVARKIADTASHQGPPIEWPSAVKSAPTRAALPIVCARVRDETPRSQNDVNNAPSMIMTPKAVWPSAASTTSGRNIATAVRTPLAGVSLAPDLMWKMCWSIFNDAPPFHQLHKRARKPTRENRAARRPFTIRTLFSRALMTVVGCSFSILVFASARARPRAGCAGGHEGADQKVGDGGPSGLSV